jgi:isocitrate lyase
MYPDQSLYPASSVPNVARRINHALARTDQIHHAQGKNGICWFAPLIADAEAGFGGALNAFELMKAMIEAGVACVHFEDQLSSAKKCGHLAGKVLVPSSEAIQKLVAARLAADVTGVPTLIMARTDADSAHLLTSDIDPRDAEFLTGERTPEGFFRTRGGLKSAIARGISYAPYADLVWCETRDRIWAKRAALRKRSWTGTPANCWRTTARLRSTGGRTWTRPPSPASKGSWRRWAINSSSSPWLVSTR